MLQNRLLTEKYSLLLLKQHNASIAAQIDIANGRNPNHLLLPSNDAAGASGGEGALETTRPSTAGASPTATQYNGSGSIDSSVDHDEAAIEILKQSMMKLALTSAEYCDELIKMNPPCSSS